MKFNFKNHTKEYVYIIIFAFVLIRILFWNYSFENNFEKIRKINHCTVTCQISEIPTYKSDYISFNAKVIKGIDISSKVRICISNADNLKLNYKDTICLKANAKIVDGEMNPESFNYKNYLKSQGVCAVLSSDIITVCSVKHGKLSKFYNARKNLTEKFFEYLPYDEASLVNALVTGSKNEMPNKLKEFFKKSGLYHIIAVSGLHLNIFIVFLSYLYINIKIKWRKKQIIMTVINTLGAIFIFMFTGFGTSVSRAAIMAIALCISTFIYREYSPLHSLIAVAIFLIFTRPYTYLDISFQLSFLSTLGIILSLSIIKKYNIDKLKYKIVAESLIMTCGAWILTLPVCIFSFGGVSLAAFISNLAALAIVPLALGLSYVFSVGCIFMPDIVCRALACITVVPVKAIVTITIFFSSIPGAYVSISPEKLIIILIQLLIVPSLVCLCRKKYKMITAFVFIGIIITNSLLIANNYFKKAYTVYFLNVGQGECSIIKTQKNKVVMVDCGSESVNNIADYIVVPFMNSRNILKIDAAIITHYHTDHTNGIIPLIKTHKIKKLLIPRSKPADDEKEIAQIIIETALKEKIVVEYISKSDKINIDKNTDFEVINPPKETITDANNKSLVLKLNCFKTKILFTGDILENSQYYILNKNIKTDILKVPHHGGFSIMSSSFAKRCNAKYSVISCGKDNNYGHPNANTLKAYKNSIIYRTDKNGLIEFKINKNSITPKIMCD